MRGGASASAGSTSTQTKDELQDGKATVKVVPKVESKGEGEDAPPSTDPPQAHTFASGSNLKLEDLPPTSSSSTSLPNTIGSTYHGLQGDWHEAIYLLAKVLPHLRSKSWDTRVAAASAVEIVCRAAGIWDPSHALQLLKKEEEDGDVKTEDAEETRLPRPQGLLSFTTFSLPHLLQTGTKLLSSAGKEYAVPAGGTIADRLAQAKRNLKDLGLDMGMDGVQTDIGLDVEAELRAGEEGTANTVNGTERATTARKFSDAQAIGAPIAKPASLPPPRFAPTPEGVGSISKLKAPCSSGGPTSTAGTAAVNGSPAESYATLPSSTAPSSAPSPTAAAAASIPTTSITPAAPSSAAPAVEKEAEIDLSKLSARERNQLKRKRKMQAKHQEAGGGGGSADAEKVRVVESPGAAGAGAVGLRIKSPSIGGVSPGFPTASSVGATGEAKDYLAVKSSSGTSALTPAGAATSSSSTPAGLTPERRPSTPGATNSLSSATAAVSSSKDGSALLAPRGEWPFKVVAEILGADLFNPQWEIRHGAALGLRELIRIQGVSCGMVVPPVMLDKLEAGLSLSAAEKRQLRRENEMLHRCWTEDMAIKILSVLSLDRLGDFIFDHVVAPVRETASQTLAALLRVMPQESIQSTHAVLIRMVLQEHLQPQSRQGGRSDGDDEEIVLVDVKRSKDRFAVSREIKGYSWEVRHAGLLGLKYELSLRGERSAVKAEKDGEDNLRQIVEMATFA